VNDEDVREEKTENETRFGFVIPLYYNNLISLLVGRCYVDARQPFSAFSCKRDTNRAAAEKGVKIFKFTKTTNTRNMEIE
jgi:hypothetical protein